MSFWNNYLDIVRDRFPEQQFKIFIAGTEFSINGNLITLTAPSSGGANWLRKNTVLNETLRKEAENTLGLKAVRIRVVKGASKPNVRTPSETLDTDAPTKNGKPGDGRSKISVAPTMHTNLNSRHTFDNFVEGKANQLAVAAGARIAIGEEKHIENHNPLFIWGSVGLGKTHLAQAIGNRFLKEKPGRKVRYITANDFVGKVVQAFRNNSQTEEFRHFFHSLDMLILDDIQFIGGEKVRSQEEFFHLFNFMVEQRKPVILTCDRLPAQIKDMHRRLTSRFQWGLMVSIDPPELELRIGILMRKAEETGIALNQEVARYIAEKMKSNVRELEGALRRVTAYAEFSEAPITLELCRKALVDILGTQLGSVTVEAIQEKVASYYKVRLADMKSARRTRTVTRPRHIGIYLTRELTDLSLPEIGKAFGGRNHTTVIHACKTIKNLLRHCPETQQEIKILRHLVIS